MFFAGIVRQPRPQELVMVALRRTRRQCQALALQAIDEMVAVAHEEGGTQAVLKLLAMLTNGEELPAPVVLHIRKQAEKICLVGQAK